MFTQQRISSISLIMLLSSMSFCTSQRSLVFAQSPLDPTARSLTELAAQQISKGSEDFALELYQVNSESYRPNEEYLSNQLFLLAN